MPLTKEVLDEIRRVEQAAPLGPWVSVGRELYYGLESYGVAHQLLPSAEIASLIAVLRSWAPDLIEAAERGLSQT